MTAAILPFLFILTSAVAQPAVPVRDAALDQEFEVRAGQWVTIEGERRGYEVKLVKLDPYPRKGRGIRKRDYVATLVVSRR